MRSVTALGKNVKQMTARGAFHWGKTLSRVDFRQVDTPVAALMAKDARFMSTGPWVE